MAFVFLILVFFIDQRGVSDKHCLLSFFSLILQYKLLEMLQDLTRNVNGPGHAKTCFMPYANNKGADLRIRAV